MNHFLPASYACRFFIKILTDPDKKPCLAHKKTLKNKNTP